MAELPKQREGESGKAYQAFSYFIESRATTQLEAYIAYAEWNWDAARAEHEQSTRNEPPRYFKQWAADYDWNKRRKDFYSDVDDLALSDLFESKARRKVERVEFLDSVQELIDDLGIPFLRKALKKGDLKVGEFIKLLDKVMQHYRSELDDMPTERLQHDFDEPAAERLALALGVALEGLGGDE